MTYVDTRIETKAKKKKEEKVSNQINKNIGKRTKHIFKTSVTFEIHLRDVARMYEVKYLVSDKVLTIKSCAPPSSYGF